MAIAASGAVSLADFRSEFVGGSAAIALGDLYRGGSNIRSKAGNNTAINLAANVPTSGALKFDDFYSQAKGFRKTYTSGATNQNASSIFGSDYGVDYPKEIVINSGVELGATSTSEEALQIDSGLSGTMTITNNGTLSGAGGSANGGAGGDAFEANAACTLINNGTIRGGGGGGGAGGTGGQGQTSYSYYGNSQTRNPNSSPSSYFYWDQHQNWQVRWSGFITGGAPPAMTSPSPVVYGGYRYTHGTQRISGFYAHLYIYYYMYDITREQQLTGYINYNGGSGGSGGVGQGYNQSAGSGSGGSGGGTNAGNGGSGGGGGSFGNSGSSGNSGGNGNLSNGSGGSSGGAAGKYIIGQSNVTFTNNGTVQGGIS